MYMTCMAECVGCRNVFSFNPDLVPSIMINGFKEPICKNCIKRINPQRIANGLEPIVPLPGAYDGIDDSFESNPIEE